MTGIASLSDIQAIRMPENDEERHKEEFLALLAIFQRLIDNVSDDMSREEIVEELMSLRADFAIHHALQGFDLSYEKALELLRSSEDGLSEIDKSKRDIVVSAIDNLVDFAVAEEYQMVAELPDLDELENEEMDDEELEELMAIFSKYNDRYAAVENEDIEYAMIVAAQIVLISNNTTLTYMTQGDERVRPWHLQYEGYSAPKSHFPAWLIPPIEHACRCYLVEDTVVGSVSNSIAFRVPDMPDWFNRTFKESVALGGRIFSDEHPYFQVDADNEVVLRDIADRIKSKYFNG